MADERKGVDQHEAAEGHPRPSPIADEERRMISDLIPNLYILLILYLCILLALNLSQPPIHPLVHHFERLDPIQQRLPGLSMDLIVDPQFLRPSLLPPLCCLLLAPSQWVPRLPRLRVQCPPMQFNPRPSEDQHSMCPFLRILLVQYTARDRLRMSAN